MNHAKRTAKVIKLNLKRQWYDQIYGFIVMPTYLSVDL